MNPQDVQTISQLLMKRIVPRDVEEGIAIAQLAQRFVQHFGVQLPVPAAAPPKGKEAVKDKTKK